MEGATSAQPDGGGNSMPSQVMEEYPKSPTAERAPPLFSLIVERVSPCSLMVETAPSPTQLTEEPCQVEDG